MSGWADRNAAIYQHVVSLLLITHYKGVLPGHEDSHQ